MKPRAAGSKIVRNLGHWSSAHHVFSNKLAATNGCFDILTAGHLAALEEARWYGDCLIVGINSDDSVRALKGPDRPVIPEDERAMLVAGLECVDFVFIFQETRCDQFLRTARPHLWIKSGYTLDTLDKVEIATARELDIRIITPEKTPCRSTTQIIDKILANKP
jgi:rfaE bifunctional protein nucleotidyltransferase chain/domain